MSFQTIADSAGQLTATTRYFDEGYAKELDLRLFAGDDGVLFVREGVGFAAHGEALRIVMPRGAALVSHVRDVLGAISVDDAIERAGSGPVAFGALPFTPGEEGFLVVPTFVVAKSSDGRAWHTTVHPTGSLAPTFPPLVAVRKTAWSPHGYDLHSAVSHERWCSIIAKAVERIGLGLLDKVVLARAVDVSATNPFVIGDMLARLEALFPSCMVFSMDIADTADAGVGSADPVRFIGASPELLVARKGSNVRAHPLAGTVARSGDPDTDARLAAGLLASSKDRWEHSLVIDAIDAVLRPLCDELDVPKVPSIVPLRNVSHLGTHITGSLHAVEVAAGAAPTALEFAGALHPTPAVGGVPVSRALSMIAELEPTPRGAYAGPVGWVDATGNGEWAVGLRSATISGCCARMMAGGGIVADSDPADELAETQLKLQALLAAVVRP